MSLISDLSLLRNKIDVAEKHYQKVHTDFSDAEEEKAVLENEMAQCRSKDYEQVIDLEIRAIDVRLKYMDITLYTLQHCKDHYKKKYNALEKENPIESQRGTK